MSEPIYIMTIGLPLLTILLIFGMRFLASTHQAQLKIAENSAYRQLAERATTSGAETARTLSALETGLTDVRARLAAIEHVLKAVE